jgi:hypothetical protein
MEEPVTHTISLPVGYVNKLKPEAGRVRRIVFGRRPTAADQALIDDDEQSELQTQRGLMAARQAIVKFGEQSRAPYMTELLQLSRADRDTVINGFSEYLKKSRGNRQFEKLDEATFKLAFGIVEAGETYDIVRLCDKASELSGYEQVEIENEHPGNKLAFALLGYSIEELSQSDGPNRLNGPIAVRLIDKLDSLDMGKLFEADAERRRLFRASREEEAQEHDRPGDQDSGSALRVDQG